MQKENYLPCNSVPSTPLKAPKSMNEYVINMETPIRKPAVLETPVKSGTRKRVPLNVTTNIL